MASLPPKEDELEQARQYAIGTLLLGVATQSGLATLASMYAAYGLRLNYLVDYSAKLAAVTRDQVAEVAARYLAPAKAVTVVLGDAAIGSSASVATLAPTERDDRPLAALTEDSRRDAGPLHPSPRPIRPGSPRRGPRPR